ncbi:RDD family protein [Microbacterium sp. SA39]|uniref:RDD family protein n=1 Tax=Microbacterium sp. SA39 TaxID=1263625 RepID=UPI0005F9B2F6|nr:RDD family protein [Microbacterium sp. SA39]KJQ53301.1 Agglutinin receptor precursor [Microbacterium sp. SA39]
MTQPAFAQIAPISRRAIGYLIDAVIAAGLAIVLGGGLLLAVTLSGSIEAGLTTLLIGGPIVSLLLLGWFVVYTLMQSKNGSIGMRAQGLRLVSARDQGPLGFGRTLLRNIIFGLAGSIVVGYFTPLFDGSGRFQGWHDKVAGSLMFDSRATPAGAQGGAPATTAIPVAGQSAEQARPAAPAIPGIPHPSTPSLASPPAASAFPAQPAAPAFPAQPAAPAFPVAPAAPVLPPQQPTPAFPVVTPPAESDSLIAFVPGITQDAPPPRVTPPPAPQPDAESELDATVQGYPVARPDAPSAPPAPSIPTVPPAPAVPVPTVTAPESQAPAPTAPESEDIEDTRISIPGHRLVFTWDDGTRVSVSRRTIFGRNPAAEDGAVVVPVRDETLSLSKTHFEAAAESSGGWVLDRHSTNGTTLVRDGQRIACPAGQRVPVRLGDAIEIGDRIVTIGGYA